MPYTLEAAVIGGTETAAFNLQDAEHAIRETLSSNINYFQQPQKTQAEKGENPIIRLDHIGVVSRYENSIRAILELIGAVKAYFGPVSEIGVHCEYHALSNIDIEIVSPTNDESVAALDRKKYPFHPLYHLAFKVTSLEEMVPFFGERGYRPVDGRVLLAPKPLHRVIFPSPVQTGGMLIELVADDREEYEVYGGKVEDRWNM